MVSLSTYGGWAGIAVIGAGYWYLQSRRSTNRSARPVPPKQATKLGDARKDGKSKKQRGEGVQSGGEQGNSSQEKSQKKKKPKAAISTADGGIPATTSVFNDTNNDDDELDNREFARQLQNAKSGKIGAAQPEAGPRQKSVKQSRAKDNKLPNGINGVDTSSNEVSKASSTADVDADDDLSAANSPTLGAAEMQALRNGDVSDMLETPSGGPSVLRIIEPATSFKPKKEKISKPSTEVIETKKQRQNRKKTDAKKEARAEDEQERRVLLEKQLRTAREAEGRPAKDGSSFMAARAPISSVWTAPPASSNSESETVSKPVELLDTYEPSTNGTSASSIPNVSKPSATKTETKWDKELPSEEEQMRLLEEETAWNTVTSKKSKKKGGDFEQPSVQKAMDSAKPHVETSEVTTSKVAPGQNQSKRTAPVTIVGDPSIDISSYSHNGGPANAVLSNGDGQDYGYTLADDEWEVA